MSAIPEADPDIPMQAIALPGEIPDPGNVPPGCNFHPRCPYAKEVCKITPPEFREYKPSHYVACHFADTLSLRGVE